MIRVNEGREKQQQPRPKPPGVPLRCGGALERAGALEARSCPSVQTVEKLVL